MAEEEDYDVFMAIAEKVGKDRRANPIYVRDEDGAEMLFEIDSSYLFKGELRHRKEKVKKIDDDLSSISSNYLKQFSNESY